MNGLFRDIGSTLVFAAMAAGVLVGAWFDGRASGQRQVQALWNAERATASAAAASASAANGAEGLRRVAEQQEIVHEAVALSTHAADAGRRAAVAGGGLRIAAAAVIAGCRAAAADPAAASASSPAIDPGAVLTDVLGRVDEEARELARIADQRGIAGGACERAYDSLTERGQPAAQ